MGNEDRLSLERQIFEACLKTPPEEQSEYIRQACSGDALLEKRIRRLLEAHQRAEQSTHPQIGLAPDDDTANDPEQIGPYRILSRIGKGGMGVVYKAEQTQPVRRVVAVKLIKQGMDTREVIARFESERQALALMNHPNIARILDAGASSQGRPYFVMEYVPGEPITAYCDRHRLSVSKRAALFVDVCEAVQHAHQKGIIHRDLKPSNLLVTVQGEVPVPKIIDFGVAKATEFRLTDRTLNTRLGMMVGTPEYMSPEQAERTGLDVDTRSDVYSLGVILYQLLTGALPFDSSTLAFAEISRLIREVDPPKPSLRILSMEDGQPSAHKRRSDPKSLSSKLRGDLDWIVMKALEKDRTRRYPSASDLAADLRRHIALEPVMAGPPSASYRLGKFARRHRASLAAALVLLTVLLGGVIGTTAGLLRARQEAERARLQAAIAEAVNQFLNQDVLSAADPENLGIDTTMRDVLEAASRQVEERFRQQPLVEAAVRTTIGRTYRNLGELDKAEEHFGKALQISRLHQGEAHPETLAGMNLLAGIHYLQGRLEESEYFSQRAFETGSAALGRRHRRTLDAADNLARIRSRQGRYEESEKLLLDSLQARLEIRDEPDPGTSATMNALGSLYWYQKDFERAAHWYNESLSLRRRVDGLEHPGTLIAMNNVGLAYRNLGRLEEAELILTETLEIRQRVLGPAHHRTVATLGLLAHVYWARNKISLASSKYQEVYQRHRSTFGQEHIDTLAAMFNLGMSLVRLGELEEGERLLSDALEIRQRVLGADHWQTLKTMRQLGELRTRQKRFDDAERLLKESLSRSALHQGEGHLETLLSRQSLAELYNLRGDYGQARSLLQEALSKAELRPSEQWELDWCRIQWGIALAGLGESSKAEEILLRSQQTLEQAKGLSSPWTQEAVQALVDFYGTQGNPGRLTHWTARLDKPETRAKPQSRKEDAK